MNRDNVLKAADYINSLEKGSVLSEITDKTFRFSMSTYGDRDVDGDLVMGCIATAICYMNGQNLFDDDLKLNYAANYLEISDITKYELFLPTRFMWHAWATVQPYEAALVLRHLAMTGKVDWSIVERPSIFSKIKNLFAAPNYKAVLTAGLFRN